MKRFYFVSSIFFLLFLVLTIMMLTNRVVELDDTIYNRLIYFRSENLDDLFKIITMLANTSTVIILTGFLVCFLKNKDRLSLLTVVISTAGINQLVKHIVRRARPDHFRLIVEKGYSFPSGHAMISIALYGYLIYFVYQNVKNKYLKAVLLSFLILLIIGIGCSRIYLGVHYPSDVLGGYCLAFMILILVIGYYNNHFKGGKLK